MYVCTLLPLEGVCDFLPSVLHISGLNIQAVDHPYLVVYSPTAAARQGGNLASNGDVEQECGICHDTVEDPAVSTYFLFLIKLLHASI